MSAGRSSERASRLLCCGVFFLGVLVAGAGAAGAEEPPTHTYTTKPETARSNIQI